MKKRSSVTNMSSESNLLKFRLNAPVIIIHLKPQQVVFRAQDGNR